MLSNMNTHGFIIYVMTAVIGVMANKISAGPQTIKPGEVWLDDRGQHIQAHGGGIIKVGDSYYWFGEDRSRDNERGKRYVSCYASKDLANWKFRNQVMKLANPENFGRGWVLERPKVFYNARTKNYVMYMHIDGPMPGERGGYKLARVGVATCDTVDGDYKYLKSFRPLGQESRDIGQFIDDDGTAPADPGQASHCRVPPLLRQLQPAGRLVH